MNTITIPGFIYLKKSEAWDLPIPGALAGMAMAWATYDPTGCSGILLVIPHALTFERPDGFDLRPAVVATLQKKQIAADAAHQALTVEINRQIYELQALEHTA